MRHVVFILLAAVCFGTTGTAQEFGPDGTSALSVGATRIVIGGGALALVAWLSTRAFRRPTVSLTSELSATRRGGALGMRRVAAPSDVDDKGKGSDGGRTASVTGSIPVTPEGAIVTTSSRGRASAPTWLVIALGAAGVVAYQPAFFAGTSINGVAVGTIVALGSAPIRTGALEWAVTRAFPGVVWLVATAVATVGVVLLTGVGGADAIGIDGLLASLGAGASYAVYALASKRLLVRDWAPTSAMGSIFGWAAAASVPLMLVTDLGWLASASGIAMALWLGLITTTLAYVLFARGLIGLSAATVSTLTLAEPLTATLLGILILNETLSTNAVIGIMVLVLGLVLLVLPRRAPAASA
jgi:DME family drug/metabolite transporter